MEYVRRDIVFCSADAPSGELLRQALREIAPHEQLHCLDGDARFLDAIRAGCRSADTADRHGPLLILVDLHPVQPLALQALSQVRSDARLNDVPVVILLAENEHHLARECSAAGANSCVDRPRDAAPLKDLFALVLHYWTHRNDVPGRSRQLAGY